MTIADRIRGHEGEHIRLKRDGWVHEGIIRSVISPFDASPEGGMSINVTGGTGTFRGPTAFAFVGDVEILELGEPA